MMRFRYPLQKIVDLKSNEKSQAEWILSQALAHLRLEEQSLEQLVANREMLANQINESAKGRISVVDLTNLQSYLEYMDTLIAQKNQNVLQAKREVVDKSIIVTNKSIDEKVWLKARKRSYDTFAKEQLRQEQYILDEMAAVGYGKLS